MKKFAQNDVGCFSVVFTVSRVNNVVARFARVIVFCGCILDFERSGSMISLVNELEKTSCFSASKTRIPHKTVASVQEILQVFYPPVDIDAIFLILSKKKQKIK